MTSRRDGKRFCRECANEAAREQYRLCAAAARHLGLTNAAYLAAHGSSRAAAKAVLAGPPAQLGPEHCPNGHPRTPENTGRKRSHGRDHRYCSACRRERDRRAWTAIIAAAEQHGISASEWVRRNGGNYSVAAIAAGMEPAEPYPARREGSAREEAARKAREATRARAAQWAAHVAHLDPDQPDWDGLSVLALCSCGWRETHPHPDGARAALKAHTDVRPDAAHVRGDRLDPYWQETA
jgi:hypothetical protein